MFSTSRVKRACSAESRPPMAAHVGFVLMLNWACLSFVQLLPSLAELIFRLVPT